MISADQARSTIIERVPVLGTVTMSLRRAAGHHLAADILALTDVPPFDNAAMDGYAVRSAETANAPVVMAIAGETAAGDAPGGPLARSTAHAVMTGAPVPRDADAVVQVEWTEAVSDREVRVLKPVVAGANIRRAGSDISTSSVPLRKGHLVRAYGQGVMASLGIEFIAVHRKPSVYFIPTGNELTAPGKPLGPGKIRESNSHVVTELLRREGCDVRSAPITPDGRALLSEAIAGGSGCDMLVTTGGVSAGRYDTVPDILAGAGTKSCFTRSTSSRGCRCCSGCAATFRFFRSPETRCRPR